MIPRSTTPTDISLDSPLPLNVINLHQASWKKKRFECWRKATTLENRLFWKRNAAAPMSSPYHRASSAWPSGESKFSLKPLFFWLRQNKRSSLRNHLKLCVCVCLNDIRTTTTMRCRVRWRQRWRFQSEWQPRRALITRKTCSTKRRLEWIFHAKQRLARARQSYCFL